MAVWLVRTVDQTQPDPVKSSHFEDVEAGQWWLPYVERLADLGITRGYSAEPVQFCPTDPVTRQQMASFLVRAFQLQPEPGNKFADVEDGNSHLAAINGLAAFGITRGCATEPDRYCPNSDTSRAQMATFLARAFRSRIHPTQRSHPAAKRSRFHHHRGWGFPYMWFAQRRDSGLLGSKRPRASRPTRRRRLWFRHASPQSGR